MINFSFIFTIFFMLLGPVKIIPAFAEVPHNKDAKFMQAVAIRIGL